jgi:type II secretory pathway pseudopilin PulG
VIGRLAHEQRGFALTELLIASVLMILVMGTAFEGLRQFEGTSGRNTHQNEAQDRARNALDLMVRRLRNDASPTMGSPQAIERASGTDLVFQSVDADPPSAGSQNSHNIMRVRYCLDDSVPSNGKVWFQYQKWTSPTAPSPPSSVSCPDTSWGNSRILVDHVVNDYNQTRPLWTIDCPSGYSDTQCAAGTDLSMLARVRRLALSIWVDERPDKAPSESRLSTGVFFRNQNARPVASMNQATVTNGHIYANASASSDPDADRMYFRWCYFGTAVPSSTWCANGSEIGQHTISIDYVPQPTPAHGSTVTIGLRVEDQGGLASYDYKQVGFP